MSGHLPQAGRANNNYTSQRLLDHPWLRSCVFSLVGLLLLLLLLLLLPVTLPATLPALRFVFRRGCRFGRFAPLLAASRSCPRSRKHQNGKEKHPAVHTAPLRGRLGRFFGRRRRAAR